MKKNIIVASAVVVLAGATAWATAGESPLGSLKLDKKAAPPESQQAFAEPAAPAPVAAPAAVPGIAQATTRPAPVPTLVQAVATKAVAATPTAVTAKVPAKVIAPTPAAMPKASPTAVGTKAAGASAPVTPAPAPVPKATPAAPKPLSAAPAPTAAAVAVPPPVIPQADPIEATPVGARARRIKPVQLSDRELAFQNQEAQLVREIRILELEAKKRELQKQITAQDQAVVDSALPPPPPPQLQSVLDVPEEPVVRLISVWGDPSKLQADVLAKGVRTSVKAGDPLPEGWKVVEVGRNSVLIQRGRDKQLVKIGG